MTPRPSDVGRCGPGTGEGAGDLGYTRAMSTSIRAVLFAAVVTIALPASLKFDAPAGWVSKPPASSMRVAEFALPEAAGDPEDGLLVVYFFGGQGGTVEANLERWILQMAQPDGKPSKDVAKTSRMTSHGLAVTLVDVSGTFVAETSPGSTDHFNKPGFRLRAAVVETTAGNYYVKLTGPQRTIAKWDDSFMAFVKSLRMDAPARAR